MEIVTTKTGLHFYTRGSTTWDDAILGELDSRSPWTYANLCTFAPTDVWLDAGGYIGTFACRFAPQVEYVYSFEPDTENFNLFLMNMVLNHTQKVLVMKRALVSNDDKQRDFFLSTGKSTAGHSLRPTRGRTKVTVQCMNFDAVLRKTQANKAKIDIEGAEVDIFEHCEGWKQLDELVFEWHFGPNGDPECRKYYALIERMKTIFPHVCAFKARPGAWIALVHCSKTPVTHPLQEGATS